MTLAHCNLFIGAYYPPGGSVSNGLMNALLHLFYYPESSILLPEGEIILHSKHPSSIFCIIILQGLQDIHRQQKVCANPTYQYHIGVAYKGRPENKHTKSKQS